MYNYSRVTILEDGKKKTKTLLPNPEPLGQSWCLVFEMRQRCCGGLSDLPRTYPVPQLCTVACHQLHFPWNGLLALNPEASFAHIEQSPEQGEGAWASELLFLCIEVGRGAQRRRPESQQSYVQAQPTILTVHFLCVCSFIHSPWTFRTVSALVEFLSWWNIS